MSEYVVYRAYDAEDRLLYVGQTARFKKRRWNHGQRSPHWFPGAVRWTVEQHPSREAAVAAEAAAIRGEGPLRNRFIPPPPLDVEELAALYKAGRSAVSIAQEFGVSPPFVFKLLREAGVPTRTVAQANRLHHVRLPLDDARIAELYQSGRSAVSIAQEFGVHNTTILKRLRKAGVQLRTYTEANVLRHARRKAAS